MITVNETFMESLDEIKSHRVGTKFIVIRDSEEAEFTLAIKDHKEGKNKFNVYMVTKGTDEELFIYEDFIQSGIKIYKV